MALFAGDDGIEAGEELTYDYNFNWFTGVSQQTCHCGADNCRGALGKKADGFQRASPPVKGKDNAKGKTRATPKGKQASAKAKAKAPPKSRVTVKSKATVKGKVAVKTRVVARTTKITGPTKTGTTIAAKGKGAIRATVKKTALGIQRSVKASSNRVRRVTRKATPPPPEESASEEEVEDEEEEEEEEGEEDNEQAGNIEEDQEEVGEVEKAEAVEKGREQSDMEGLESIRVASSPGQAVLSDFARQRIRNRGGKPRVTKTYKVGKTIRAKYYKGKLGPRKKAIQDAITPLLASRSSSESATITLSTATRSYREIAPKPLSDAGASSSMSSTSGASASGRVGVRRSVRRSAAPNSAQNTVQAFEALVAGHPATLGQALNTVLATSVEPEGALPTGISVECTV